MGQPVPVTQDHDKNQNVAPQPVPVTQVHDKNQNVAPQPVPATHDNNEEAVNVAPETVMNNTETTENNQLIKRTSSFFAKTVNDVGEKISSALHDKVASGFQQI